MILLFSHQFSGNVSHNSYLTSTPNSACVVLGQTEIQTSLLNTKQTRRLTYKVIQLYKANINCGIALVCLCIKLPCQIDLRHNLWTRVMTCLKLPQWNIQRRRQIFLEDHCDMMRGVDKSQNMGNCNQLSGSQFEVVKQQKRFPSETVKSSHLDVFKTHLDTTMGSLT